MNAENDDECAGAGKCHGCLKWCNYCGDVAHVCDARLAGHPCDEHPIPPSKLENLRARRAAEKMIRDGARLRDQGLSLLNSAADSENARRAYDRQLWQLREQEELALSGGVS